MDIFVPSIKMGRLNCIPSAWVVLVLMAFTVSSGLPPSAYAVNIPFTVHVPTQDQVDVFSSIIDQSALSRVDQDSAKDLFSKSELSQSEARELTGLLGALQYLRQARQMLGNDASIDEVHVKTMELAKVAAEAATRIFSGSGKKPYLTRGQYFYTVCGAMAVCSTLAITGAELTHLDGAFPLGVGLLVTGLVPWPYFLYCAASSNYQPHGLSPKQWAHCAVHKDNCVSVELFVKHGRAYGWGNLKRWIQKEKIPYLNYLIKEILGSSIENLLPSAPVIDDDGSEASFPLEGPETLEVRRINGGASKGPLTVGTRDPESES